MSDVICRACRRASETLMHWLSACPAKAVLAYIHRPNAALRVLYYHLRHSYEVDQEPVPPYFEIFSPLSETRGDKFFGTYKPDMVLLDKEWKTTYVIEFSAPVVTNIVLKEEEKRTKYQDLLFELRTMYPDHNIVLIVLIYRCSRRNSCYAAIRIEDHSGLQELCGDTVVPDAASCHPWFVASG